MANNGQWIAEVTTVYTRCDSPLCGQCTRWYTPTGQPPAGIEPQCGCCYKLLAAWDVVAVEDIPKGVIICNGRV